MPTDAWFPLVVYYYDVEDSAVHKDLLSAHLGHDFPGISGAVFSRRGTARHRRGISRVRR